MKEKGLTYFTTILRKYRNGTATAAEADFLEKYYGLFEEKESYLDSLDLQAQEHIKAELKKSIDEEIDRLSKTPIKRIFGSNYIKYFAAASILLICAVTGYLVLKTPPYQAITKTNDFIPGSNRAKLKLNNGTEILLDTAATGTIALVDGITITKKPNGEIEYHVQSDTNDEVGYNTITTPNGGQYQIVLQDGSRVWLNAGSSLRYPTVFKGKDRVVEITGEGYFEVAKNKQMPFKVITEQQTVEVLGTHFNINAYTNEDAVKTTLLEGAVRVTSDKNTAVMLPGEQVSFDVAARTFKKKIVDVEQEVAWKNGLFSFKGDDIKTIMRQISRWYDVEIVYDGPITNEKFFGDIARNSKLSEVIAILELNNVHFKSRGRKITVSANQKE